MGNTPDGSPGWAGTEGIGPPAAPSLLLPEDSVT